MKKKFMLRVMAWLLAVAMLLPSAGNVFTAYAEEGKVAYSGSVEMTGNDAWWNQNELSQADLLGGVAPADVKYIRVYSDKTFTLGYNSEAGSWKQIDKVTEYKVDDIDFGASYCFAIVLNENADFKSTIKWDVCTSDAGATETPKTPTTTTGKKISLTTENTDFGATNVVAPSEFEAYKNDGVKLYIEFDQEDAPWWNLAPVTQADGWPRLAPYMLNQSANKDGFIQTFSKGDSNITIELSAEGVQKIIADGGLRFQVKALKVTSVTISPLKDMPKATATPKPTATPTPTPVPITEDTYKTVGDVLLVTEDMVKNGTVTVERAQYNSIIIPANLKADVLLKTVKADEIVVEGGADYTVTLYRCDIDKMDVTAPEVKVMTIEELNAALKEAGNDDDKVDAVIAQFQADFAAKKAAEAAQVELVTTYFTTVKELNVKTSAKIDTNDCEVDQINLAMADVEERMNIEVEEFNGAMSADLDRADGAFAALFMLDLEDSKLSALDVTGADSSCFIEGKASVVDAINVADAANITLNATTGKIVVGEKATGAKVRVYSQVNEVVVKGDANSIVLPTCAEIGNAVVEGNNVKIYGYGELESAVITGTGANVAVYGTAVEGDNDSTPPAAMIAMNPYKDLVKERPSAPEEDEEEDDTKHKIEITLDDAYAGNYSVETYVDEADLALFGGEVEVTIEYKLQEGDYEYPQFTWALVDAPKDGNNWVNIAKSTYTTNNYISDAGWVLVSKDATSLTYTWSEDAIASAINQTEGTDDQLGLQIHGIIITKVTMVGDKKVADGDGEEDNDELVIEDNWVVANTADVTLNNEGGWWTEHEISMDDILNGISEDDVKCMKLTGDTSFTWGYSSTASESGWAQLEGETTYIVNDLKFADNSVFKICISKGDSVDYHFTWEIYVEKTEEDSNDSIDPSWVVANTADVTLNNEGGWWTEHEISMDDILNGISEEDVKCMKLTGDTSFTWGYSSTTSESGWAQLEGEASYIVNDLKFADNSVFKICISKGDSVDYHFTWEVYVEEDALEEDRPQEVTYKAADLTLGGYGHLTREVNDDGSVTATFPADSYYEISFILPEEFSLNEYDKLIVEMETNAGVYFKTWDVAPLQGQWGGVAYQEKWTNTTSSIEVDLRTVNVAEYTAAEVSYETLALNKVSVTTLQAATEVTVKSITIVPAE